MQNKAIESALAEIAEEAEGFEEEFARLENKCANLEGKLEESEIQNDKLLEDIAQLSEYVQDLETALAEAHLMSTDDGPEIADNGDHKDEVHDN